MTDNKYKCVKRAPIKIRVFFDKDVILLTTLFYNIIYLIFNPSLHLGLLWELKKKTTQVKFFDYLAEYFVQYSINSAYGMDINLISRSRTFWNYNETLVFVISENQVIVFL